MDEKVLEQNQAITGGEEQNLEISADLIRGHINTIILRCLYDADKYGYEIIDEIKKKSGGLYTLKEPTLYSALKRLESLQYVNSYYGDYSNGGRRKYFSLTQTGRTVTTQNLSAWEYSRTIIDSLISDGDAHYDFSFITDKQTELIELKRSLAARENALNEEKAALNNLKNELQRERALLSTQSSSISSQKTDFLELKEKVELQAQELSAKESALLEKQAQIQTKESELLDKAQQIDQAKAELESQSQEIKTLKDLLETQRVAFAKQEEEITRLQSENANKSTDFYNKELELRAQQAQMETQKTKLETEKLSLKRKNLPFCNYSNSLRKRKRSLQIAKRLYSRKRTIFYKTSAQNCKIVYKR